jgi:hypothetical protein
MVTRDELIERFAECGYHTPKESSLTAARNGHAVVIVERTPIYVGAFSKDCKTVAEQWPDHVTYAF